MDVCVHIRKYGQGILCATSTRNQDMYKDMHYEGKMESIYLEMDIEASPLQFGRQR